MLKKLIVIAAVLVGAVVALEAQQRALAALSMQTTDTSANSLLVGCAVGSTTCTGGIKAGPIVSTSGTFTTLNAIVGTSATLSGPLAVTSTNGASQPFAVRYNASNPSIGFGLANSNGYGYLGSNVKGKVGSDTATYDLTGFATQMRVDSGAFRWFTAPSGTAAADITFTERWGINNAGDFTIGASSNIADSSGTPTIQSSFGTTPSIRGTDYAFQVTNGTPPNNGTVAFGHTWSTIPVCVISIALSSGAASTQTVGGIATTTTLIISHSSGGDAGGKISVLCRSY